MMTILTNQSRINVVLAKAKLSQLIFHFIADVTNFSALKLVKIVTSILLIEYREKQEVYNILSASHPYNAQPLNIYTYEHLPFSLFVDIN